MIKIRLSAFLLFFLLIISAPSLIFAATTYKRSPSGDNIENPVSTSFSFQNLSDIDCFSGINFWQIIISSEGAPLAGGAIRPISELNGQDQFTLPFLTYDPVDVYGAVNKTIDENGILTGDCGTTIGPGFSVMKPASGITIHTPVINFSNVSPDQYLTGIQPLKYSASDEDEKIKGTEHGLKENPVSIYYSQPNSFDWFLIAKNQPASGTVLWDTSKLPDKDGYRIKATATGADNDFNQKIIEGLTLDNTAPHFTVKAEPLFSRGEPVKIEMESSEILRANPVLTIAQFGNETIRVALTGDVLSRKFYGTYEIIPGFDGPADIKISGEDLAGNKSGNIIGDSLFTVGIKPPPQPQIEILSKNIISAGQLIPLIKGFAVNAEKTILKINGSEKIIEVKNKNGYFQFENIGLDPKFNKGRNILTVISQDKKGRMSTPTVIEAFINSPPAISWLEPRKQFARLNGPIQFSWLASDINDNPISYQLELSDNRGQTWQTIAKDLKEQEFIWDSSSVPDNSNYIFKVTASDGSLKSSALSKRISISNDLPMIILETGGDFFTNETSKIFKGVVRSKKDLLSKLEYSSDNGKNWKEILPEDKKWDSTFERFNFAFPELKTGGQNIIIKGLTVSGKTVVNAQNLKIIFDNKNPDLSVETLPKVTINKNMLSMNGVGRDDFSGIKTVEYAIDDSKWYKGNITKGLGAKTSEFKIEHPEPLEDGSHRIKIRVIDFAGNISAENVQTLTVDATAPRFGGFAISNNNKNIYPTAEKIFTVLPETTLNLKIALSEKPEKITTFINNKIIPIQFNPKINLWESNITIKQEGWFILKIIMEDKLGNKNEKEVARIQGIKTVPSDAASFQKPQPENFWDKIINLFK